MRLVIILSIIYTASCKPLTEITNNTKVVQVSVIFRHGARTTDFYYPKDPNIGETYYPIGLGGLTNEGKMQEYKLGKYLREEYSDILGDNYLDSIVEARSTDTLRTKQSALLVLAGLYPPSKQQLWNEALQWQPIPVFFKEKQNEDLIHPDACPRKEQLTNDLINNAEIYEKYIKPYTWLYKFVEENTGKSITTPRDLIDVYFILKTESDLNMTIPAWVEKIYPEPLHVVSSTIYNYVNQLVELKQINAGYLLQKILNDFENMIYLKDTKKMFLYSGHETTLGYMLYSMGLLVPHVPPYSSSMIFELHKDDNDQYYIKMKYRKSPIDLVDLVIPGCPILCPIETFKNKYDEILPKIPIGQACRSSLDNATS